MDALLRRGVEISAATVLRLVHPGNRTALVVGGRVHRLARLIVVCTNGERLLSRTTACDGYLYAVDAVLTG